MAERKDTFAKINGGSQCDSPHVSREQGKLFFQTQNCISSKTPLNDSGTNLPGTNLTKSNDHFNTFDVIGGDESAHFTGNIRYRKLIDNLVVNYCDSTHERKSAMIKDVYKLVASCGGRFFERTETTGYVVEMRKSSALLKIRADLQLKELQLIQSAAHRRKAHT
jgi:hypothetical protein